MPSNLKPRCIDEVVVMVVTSLLVPSRHPVERRATLDPTNDRVTNDLTNNRGRRLVPLTPRSTARPLDRPRRAQVTAGRGGSRELHPTQGGRVTESARKAHKNAS